MRREHITYADNLPVKIQLVRIKEYPIHWHEAIEILMVLKGSVNVSIESDTYKLIENEIEIVNLDEAHRIYSEEENLVLVMHIDINFFQKYYDDIKNIYFYTDCSFEGEPQVGEKYDLLKKYLSIITCEVVQKSEDYDLYIKETLVELLYLLINDFHYLIYENEELKDNVEQLQRYHRIAKYIYNNYNNKISLQDIAEKEFLSTHYLSNEIKYAMGINFKDFVNLTRVEESVKLLLDTDMNISEISEEVGFSHTRYYNKHFKRHYKMTPLQYRKKFKIDEDKIQEFKEIQAHDLKEVLDFLVGYLEDYDRYDYEDKVYKINIDASKQQGDFSHDYEDSIRLPRAKNILEREVYESLKTLQREIGFEYGQIVDIFSYDMGISHEGIINLKKIKKVMDILLSLDLRPDIVFGQNSLSLYRYREIVVQFLDYFKKEYGSYEISKWRYTIDAKASKEVKDLLYNILKMEYDFFVKEEDLGIDDTNFAYDMAYMVPYIIHQTINGKTWFKMKAIDDLEKLKASSNVVFFGDSGLLNWEGLKKPSYHAYFFLSKLGDTIVDKGDGYIITSKGEDLQVLLYNYGDDIDLMEDIAKMDKLRRSGKVTEKNISLNITNMWYKYTLTKYEIHERINSVFNHWKYMGSPSILADDEIELLKLSSMPRISLGYRKKMPIQHLNIKIKGYGAVLILFKALG